MSALEVLNRASSFVTGPSVLAFTMAPVSFQISLKHNEASVPVLGSVLSVIGTLM